MTATVIRADARALPLADASVDLIVTSPPFLNLRSYQDGGRHYEGQIGAGTRDRYLEDLWEVTAECARVLKPTGSIFVELGDSYTNKSLNMSPHRYAIGCVDRLGLILRAELIWSRPNGLPESVTDRVRRSHSVWFHLVKSPRYFAAVDTIREAHEHHRRDSWDRRAPRELHETLGHTDARMGNNPLGKLPGSVWEIPSQPLTVPAELGVDHFAAFPMEWPRRIIQGWSPPGVCTACGEGRRPVAERTANGHSRETTTARDPSWQAINRADWQEGVTRIITGEACACPDTTAPTRPAVVLDPFGGTGTTALVADVLGRRGVSVDRSADYCRLARWRTTDSGQRAAAMQVEKPAPQVDGQADLLSLIGGLS